MTENNKNEDAELVPVSVDADLIVELNFVPDWARKPPSASQSVAFSSKGYGRHDAKKGKYGGFDKKKRRDVTSRRPDQNARRPMFADKNMPNAGSSERKSEYKGRSENRSQSRYIELPEVNVQFLPRRQRLAAVVGRVKSENKAFPIAAMASIFLSDPAFCNVKIEVRHGVSDLSIYSCKECGMISVKKEVLVEHVLNTHMGDYFDKDEVLGDLPTGTFVCVAKCGMSGILLGPPNHHSYDAKVREVHQSRFANMSLAAYQKRIESLHDEDLIERWKDESRKKTVYRLKDNKEVADMTLLAATEYFRENVLSKIIKKARRAVIPAEVARKVDDPGLAQLFRSAWSREHRNPYSIVLALRGAFKSMHLFVFKAGKGQGFVTPTRPKAIDPQHTVENIREVLLHLQANPGCTREGLIDALRPDHSKDDKEVAELLSPLGWLIDKGHIIEFFNGALSVPLKT